MFSFTATQAAEGIALVPPSASATATVTPSTETGIDPVEGTESAGVDPCGLVVREPGTDVAGTVATGVVIGAAVMAVYSVVGVVVAGLEEPKWVTVITANATASAPPAMICAAGHHSGTSPLTALRRRGFLSWSVSLGIHVTVQARCESTTWKRRSWCGPCDVCPSPALLTSLLRLRRWTAGST